MGFLDFISPTRSLTTIGEEGVDPIMLDCSVRQAHTVTGLVTEHPVEEGIDITDHYRVLPRALEVEGIISDSPLTRFIPGATLINSAIGLISGEEKASYNAWQELNRFFDEAVVVTITTSLEVYPNRVLTDLVVNRSSGESNGLYFTFTAREIKFVTVATGLSTAFGGALGIADSATAKNTTGQKTAQKGKSTTKTASEPQAKKQSALLKNGISAGIFSP